jgi:hypothetical protein
MGLVKVFGFGSVYGDFGIHAAFNGMGFDGACDGV